MLNMVKSGHRRAGHLVIARCRGVVVVLGLMQDREWGRLEVCFRGEVAVSALAHLIQIVGLF